MNEESARRAVEAVTDEQIALAGSRLREETRGIVVGEPITDLYFKKLATLHFLTLWELHRTYRGAITYAIAEESGSILLGNMVEKQLATHYGHYVTAEEWASQEVFLWIRKGWRVHKVRHDIYNDPDKEKVVNVH